MHREVEVRGNLIFRQSLKIDREKPFTFLYIESTQEPWIIDAGI